MIISALNRYYHMLASDAKTEVPLYGYSRAKVGFALNIDIHGQLLDIIPLHVEDKGKRLISRVLTVPEQKQRSSGISPNFMSDNSTYVLGFDKKGKPERSREAFRAFRELHEKILNPDQGSAAKAILAFLGRWDVDKVEQHPILQDCLEEVSEGSNLVFKLDGEKGYLHDDQKIKTLWEQFIFQDSEDILAQCLITGEKTYIARLHPNIKNVKNAQTSGASIVSFNATAYESYGKTQSYNSPVGKNSAFGYTTILNYMLANPRQKIQVGDATTVFWAESPKEIYLDLAAELFNPTVKKEEAEEGQRRRDQKVENLIQEVLIKAKTGSKINHLDDEIDERTKFYILGLSPNASRISVRFFHADSFGGFLKKVAQHYQDMELIKDFENRPDNVPIWMMLSETISSKSSNKEAAPLLAGALMRSIIEGTSYPAALFNAIMIRIRADMDEQKINYTRVALIKAYLLRNARISKNNDLKEVLTMGLNEQSKNIAYLLGRLFAVLEKAQQDANPGINTTIKDRYFNSACATPAAVFPILLRLAQHHIAKADYGYVSDKRIEPIINEIEYFPSHLNLEEQGVFILGYYHQRVAFFKKVEKDK